MKRILALAVSLAVACVAGLARSGHEFPIYPSYYPHRIGIEAMTPDRAGALLVAGKIQAYIGAEPRFAGAAPDFVQPIESLGSLVVVRINPQSPRANDRTAACALARTVFREIARHPSQLRVHPYPVTPYDGDYLDYADLADAARARLAGDSPDGASSAPAAPQVRVAGALAKSLVPASWLARGNSWDAAVDEIDAAGLVASATRDMNGWIAPPWLRSGWFRTALLLASSADDPKREASASADRARLEAGTYASAVERVNLERDLVSALASSCHALVAGYTVKREFVNAEYSAGIENIGFDSIAGLDSPIFIRTAKLKDFPWNGVLDLGVASPPAAAWNPIAGFTDPFGRLLWYAVGDPALLPLPNGALWMLNRVSDVR